MLLNVTEIGSPRVDNGVVSGFSSANYLKITDSFNVSSAQSWEVVYKIKTGTDITTGQSMCGHTGSSNYDPFTIDVNSSRFQLGLCNTSSTNLLKDVKGTYTVLANTTYWLKLTFNGSRYALSYSLNGVDFIEDVSLESTTKIWTSDLVLGRQQGASSEFPFLGSIDLNESYIKINGELWWTGIVEGGIKPVRSYALKRRKTTREAEWYCFRSVKPTYYYEYLDHEIAIIGEAPYVGDIHASLAKSAEEIDFQLGVSIISVTDNGFIWEDSSGETKEFVRYPDGDLNVVVKTEDSFYSLQRRGNKKPNITKIGSPTINNGIVSGFSDSNYLKLPMVFTPVDKPWEITLKFATGSIGTRQKIFAHVAGLDWLTPTINIETDGEISLNVSTSGSSWLINRSSNIVRYLLNANTEYEVIAQFTGSSYIMKVKSTSETEYTTVLNYSSNSAFYQNVAVIPTIGFENYGGTYTFFGSIDLNESYIKINGETWWTGMVYNNNSYVLTREKN